MAVPLLPVDRLLSPASRAHMVLEEQLRELLDMLDLTCSMKSSGSRSKRAKLLKKEIAALRSQLSQQHSQPPAAESGTAGFEEDGAQLGQETGEEGKHARGRGPGALGNLRAHAGPSVPSAPRLGTNESLGRGMRLFSQLGSGKLFQEHRLCRLQPCQGGWRVTGGTTVCRFRRVEQSRCTGCLVTCAGCAQPSLARFWEGGGPGGCEGPSRAPSWAERVGHRAGPDARPEEPPPRQDGPWMPVQPGLWEAPSGGWSSRAGRGPPLMLSLPRLRVSTFQAVTEAVESDSLPTQQLAAVLRSF